MNRVVKLAADSGVFNLRRTANPGVSEFGVYQTPIKILQPFPEDGVVNVWLSVRITDFDGLPHHLYFNVFDNGIYPQVSSFDGSYDGWVTQQLAPPVVNQSTNGTRYTRYIKDYQATKALQLGFVVQHAAPNPVTNPTSTVAYEVEAWCEF